MPCTRLAIVDEYRWKDRMERKWILETNGDKRLLWKRSWEDRYTAPGEPLTRRGAWGEALRREADPGLYIPARFWSECIGR